MYTWKEKKKNKLIHYLLNIPRVFTICRDVWERAGHSAQEMNAPREYDDQHFTKGKERKEIYFVGARVWPFFFFFPTSQSLSAAETWMCHRVTGAPIQHSTQTQDDDLPVSPRGPVLPQFRGQSFLNK
jgi:hypothetical protein